MHVSRARAPGAKDVSARLELPGISTLKLARETLVLWRHLIRSFVCLICMYLVRTKGQPWMPDKE